MASAVSFSGNVLHDLFGRGIKDFRVLENAAYIFESDGIRVPVGNAFVAGDAVIHITAFVDLAFAVELVFCVFHAEGKEYRNVAEVVKMVYIGGMPSEPIEVMAKLPWKGESFVSLRGSSPK